MGACWCKNKQSTNSQPYLPTTEAQTQPTPARSPQYRSPSQKHIDTKIIDNLVIEMVGLVSATIFTNEEPPVTLVKLRLIADSEDGWINVVISMVRVTPLEDPFGASAITLLLDDCPLPTKQAIDKLMDVFKLSHLRANSVYINIQEERNTCIILGAIVEKLASPNRISILTNNTLDYLMAYVISKRETCIVLFALLALEKFAQTTENKITIMKRLEEEPENPLLDLERYYNHEDMLWRQVGFCAKWILDNIFVIKGRKLSYKQENMNNINVILNTHDVSEYLKIGPNGLEARSDSYSFESVRCTFQVDEGIWYYESTVITPGVMQIGWATKHSHFLNHEGFGIGDDLYSISYDGCRRLIWYMAHPVKVDSSIPAWVPGDTLGCLLDMTTYEIVFFLNGVKICSCCEIFNSTRSGFFAAASFMAFQQCKFNFGHEPFKFPPTDRDFSCFNDYGHLTPEQKQVIPRRILLEQLRNTIANENACTLCCDEAACCILKPCGHTGFCSVCTSQLTECPMCRGPILDIEIGEML